MIRLVFELFEPLDTISGVLCHLVENDIKMPVRAPGSGQGELEWRRPSRPSLGDLFQSDLCRRLRLRGAADQCAANGRI